MNEPGATLKWIAGLIAAMLFVCAFFIFKTDPIRNDGRVRSAAIDQVKGFAKFIETRPEIAHPEQRSVVAMIATIRPAFSEEFAIEMKRRILELSLNEQKAQLKSFLIEHEEEGIKYFKAKLSVPQTEHTQEWEGEMEVLLMIARDSDFKSETKSSALDLFGRQLLDARTDPMIQVQKKTDAWYEDYLKAEFRPAYKNAIISAYQLRINQAARTGSEK